MTNIWKNIIYDNLNNEELKVLEEMDKDLVKDENELTSIIEVGNNNNIFRAERSEDKLFFTIESGYTNSKDIVYNNAEPKVNHKEFERICLIFDDLEYVRKIKKILDDMIEVAEKEGFE